MVSEAADTREGDGVSLVRRAAPELGGDCLVSVLLLKGVEAEERLRRSQISSAVLFTLRALVSVSHNQGFILRYSGSLKPVDKIIQMGTGGAWGIPSKWLRNPSPAFWTRKLWANGFCKRLHSNNSHFMDFGAKIVK